MRVRLMLTASAACGVASSAFADEGNYLNLSITGDGHTPSALGL